MKLSKKLSERFDRLETEGGLTDDCKYMLYLAEGWGIPDVPPMTCVPVFSKKEAVEWLKKAVRI